MLKVLAIGAHPDDCEVAAGGTAALWRRRGDAVRFVSVTNGNAGHHTMAPAELAARRAAEAAQAAAVIGIEHEVLSNDDGRLEPTLKRRLEVIRLIRRFGPDLILTHRPNDYHPDHRYTATLVQDSAYLVTVPRICPETPHLRENPAIAYFHDRFKRPCPFVADIAVDVDPVMDLKWAMLHAHASQFYEWLPYNDGTAGSVPPPEAGERARREWLERRWGPVLEAVAGQCRERLMERYGPDHAADIEFAEAFELSELGARPDRARLEAMFPLE
ncbi:MAG: PIG-L family deacetylase [Planctomycetes bacterium]|nr:PIG-L family deacetylase [Planctomycetota bacterium]